MAYVYANTDTHTNTSADVYSMAYSYTIPNTNAYPCCYADCCTDTDASAHIDTNAGADGYCYTDANSDCSTYTGSHTDNSTYCDL